MLLAQSSNMIKIVEGFNECNIHLSGCNIGVDNTICDTASTPILHPDKGMLHSLNPSTILIMLLAQSSNPCISLTGINSLVWAKIVLLAIFEAVFTKLVCTSLVLILYDTR